MSEALDVVIGMLRGSGLELEGPPERFRADFDAMLMAAPLPEHIEYTPSTIAGIPVLESRSAATGDRVLVYVHGGAFIGGSTRGYAGFSGAVAHAAGALGISVEYRLAPEHPYPAALEDVVAVLSEAIAVHGASKVVLVGDSAGGALTIATLVRLREQGGELPAAAIVFSPWVDLTDSAPSLVERAEQDPSLTPAGLRKAADDYRGALEPADPGVSPLFADLSGLPPTLIQVGSIEILLDDALSLAGGLARAHVEVDLHVQPGHPHVYPSFAGLLPEGDRALEDVGRFVAAHVR